MVGGSGVTSWPVYNEVQSRSSPELRHLVLSSSLQSLPDFPDFPFLPCPPFTLHPKGKRFAPCQSRQHKGQYLPQSHQSFPLQLNKSFSFFSPVEEPSNYTFPLSRAFPSTQYRNPPQMPCPEQLINCHCLICQSPRPLLRVHSLSLTPAQFKRRNLGKQP